MEHRRLRRRQGHAHRGCIVIGHEGAQLQQVVGHRRCGVEHIKQFLDARHRLALHLALHVAHHPAHPLLAAKGHQHASAGDRHRAPLGHRIGEERERRNRNRYLDESTAPGVCRFGPAHRDLTDRA